MENNKKRNNNLFALEQGLFGNKTSQQQSQQPSPKKRKRRREEARAFDFGEAIELRYNGEAFPTATPAARSFSAPNSFASELEDESLPFEVEAFEVDEEVVPVSKQVTPKPETPVKPEIAEDVTSKQMEVQPVKATVVPPSDIPLKSARPVKQPSRVEETPSKEELSDAEAFAADLQAILNGEKTYDSEQQQVVPTSPTAPPPAPTSHPHDIFDKGQAATPTPPQKPVEPKPVPMSRSHAVFDQMGKNMAHATNFDQGTVDLALEQRFDEFDRILDEEEGKPDDDRQMGQAMGWSEKEESESPDEEEKSGSLEEKILINNARVIHSNDSEKGAAIHNYYNAPNHPDVELVKRGGRKGEGILTRVPVGEEIYVDWGKVALDPNNARNNYVWSWYQDEQGTIYQGYINKIHIVRSSDLTTNKVISSNKAGGAAIHKYKPGNRDEVQRGRRGANIVTRVPVGQEIEVNWNRVGQDSSHPQEEYVWCFYENEQGNTYEGYINKDHILAQTSIEQVKQFTDKRKYPKLFEIFKAFSEKEFSSESVYFIDEFKQLKASREDQDIVGKITYFMELYILEDADRVINISSETRSSIKHAYELLNERILDEKTQNEYVDNMIQALEQANIVMLRLLAYDTLSRFLFTPEYKNLS